MDWWVWLLIALGVLLVIGLIVFFLIRAGRKPVPVVNDVLVREAMTPDDYIPPRQNFSYRNGSLQ